MKKVVLNAFLLGFIFVGFTSCESNNLDEETFEIFETEQGDSVNPAGSGNDEGDNDEE